ncbi:hypothetical protein NY2A_B800R [Paramecium bursaria Chlorella virus NY2A]|uniref:Uncharacterized protein B800R n=1 Tax=Paramecium bursaria Chlorella virus NY2A TaxID=46021 RepID=A7IXX5_PBCVN|nr:hypothetical protein NY2A_B800R [Paramecium bursaria Chlorella virus NY2A]ABT15199.1 hypothetical protein NY2A_B800R [Paramecium bursaria Chlorella virus NY2A]
MCIIRMAHVPNRSSLTPIPKPCSKQVARRPLENKVINFDRQITEFEIQAMFSGSILLFSMVMLLTERGESSTYLPLITSVCGLWAPSPRK